MGGCCGCCAESMPLDAAERATLHGRILLAPDSVSIPNNVRTCVMANLRRSGVPTWVTKHQLPSESSETRAVLLIVGTTWVSICRVRTYLGVLSTDAEQFYMRSWRHHTQRETDAVWRVYTMLSECLKTHSTTMSFDFTRHILEQDIYVLARHAEVDNAEQFISKCLPAHKTA